MPQHSLLPAITSPNEHQHMCDRSFSPAHLQAAVAQQAAAGALPVDMQDAQAGADPQTSAPLMGLSMPALVLLPAGEHGRSSGAQAGHGYDKPLPMLAAIQELILRWGCA